MRKRILKLFGTAFTGLLLLAAPACTSGPFPSEVVVWDDAAKAAQREAASQLISKLELASLSGERGFTIPKGNYRFSKTSKKGSHNSFISLDKLNDMTIDGSGSTFWFEDEAWGFHITNCSNLTMKNIIMDWDPLPYTQGTITGVNPKDKTLDVDISPGYEKVSKRFASLPPVESDKEATVRGFIFDAKTSLLKPCQEGFRVVPFLQTPKVGGAYRVKTLIFYNKPLESLNAKVGDKITFLMRSSGGILMEGCSGMTLEDITQYSCPGLQFVEGACGGERNVYRRCKVLPRPGTDRLMGGNADGFHSQNCEYGPLIESCEITAIGDDSVNIHGFYRKVVKQISPTEILVENLAWRGKLKDGCTVNFNESPEKGFGFIGQRKLMSMRFENGKHYLKLDKDISVDADSVCSIEDYTGEGAIIRNCHFKNIAVRGILFKSHNGTIENNTFEWIGGKGIILTTQPGFWDESALPHDVKITGNKIIDVYGGPGICAFDPSKDLAKAQKISNILIKDNTITRTAGPSIQLRGAKGVEIIGNALSGDHTVYSNEFGEYLIQARSERTAAIAVEGVEDLVEKGNEIDCGAGKPIGEEKAVKHD